MRQMIAGGENGVLQGYFPEAENTAVTRRGALIGCHPKNFTGLNYVGNLTVLLAPRKKT